MDEIEEVIRISPRAFRIVDLKVDVRGNPMDERKRLTMRSPPTRCPHQLAKHANKSIGLLEGCNTIRAVLVKGLPNLLVFVWSHNLA